MAGLSPGSLQGAAFAAYFILTRKIGPVLKGEGKKVYIPYVPPGPFVPPNHPLVEAVYGEEKPMEEMEMKKKKKKDKEMVEAAMQMQLMQVEEDIVKAEQGLLNGPEEAVAGQAGEEITGGEQGQGNGGGPPENGNGMQANGNGMFEPGNDPHGNINGHFGNGPGPQEESSYSSYSSLKKRSLRGLPKDVSLDNLPHEPLPAAFLDVGGPQEMVWTAAFQMDTTGCSLKLLCHLQEISHAASTPEEAVLVMLFKEAASQDPPDCMQDFPDCPMSAKELRVLLHQI